MLLAQENEIDLSFPISSHLKHLFFGRYLTAIKLGDRKNEPLSGKISSKKLIDTNMPLLIE